MDGGTCYAEGDLLSSCASKPTACIDQSSWVGDVSPMTCKDQIDRLAIVLYLIRVL